MTGLDDTSVQLSDRVAEAASILKDIDETTKGLGGKIAKAIAPFILAPPTDWKIPVCPKCGKLTVFLGDSTESMGGPSELKTSCCNVVVPL